MTTVSWVCRKCGGPIIVDASYTKHRLGRLCKACYMPESNAYTKQYKDKIKWGRMIGRQGPCKPQFLGDVHDVDVEYQAPKVSYCLCCGHRLILPNVYCDAICQRNYEQVGCNKPLPNLPVMFRFSERVK